MKAHIVTNGKVTNTIEVESLDFMIGLIDASNGGTIGDNYADGVFTKPLPTAEEAEEAKRAATESAKQTGVEILGVMCSATKDDQNGLTAIAMGVTLARMSAATFPDTVFQFSNGNTLTVTESNFNAIYDAWVPFRQSFFMA